MHTHTNTHKDNGGKLEVGMISVTWKVREPFILKKKEKRKKEKKAKNRHGNIQRNWKKKARLFVWLIRGQEGEGRTPECAALSVSLRRSSSSYQRAGRRWVSEAEEGADLIPLGPQGK